MDHNSTYDLYSINFALQCLNEGLKRFYLSYTFSVAFQGFFTKEYVFFTLGLRFGLDLDPGTEEPSGLPSMGSLGVGHDCVTFK